MKARNNRDDSDFDGSYYGRGWMKRFERVLRC